MPISSMARVRLERVLPVPGQILVRIGEQVEATQAIARIPVRGEIQVFNVARVLGMAEGDLSQVMVKKRGDWVQSGELLAARQGILPFWHKPCRSPLTGRVIAISHGWVVIEAEHGALPRSTSREYPSVAERRIEAGLSSLPALVPGYVVDITGNRSVTIETVGAHIVGVCGLGGEGTGVLRVAVDGPGDMLTADDIKLGFNHAVLLGGAGLTSEVVERAGEMQIRGIIVGSISAGLESLPAPPFPIVATEGYGRLSMSPTAFDILKRQEGREVYLNGRGDQTRQNLRPIVVAPLTDYVWGEHESLTSPSLIEPVRVGDRVRAVRRPFMGHVGEILSFSAEPQVVPSGFSLTGAQVAFAGLAATESQREKALQADESDGVSSEATVRPGRSSRFVPWPNLERIG
jgi:hypothetical protein